MSGTADEFKHDLEYLRLASDLMQLSRNTLDPELQAHCIRMAAYWNDRAASRPQHVSAKASKDQ